MGRPDLVNTLEATLDSLTRRLRGPCGAIGLTGLSLAENLVLCQVAMAPDGRLRMVEIADLLSLAKSAVTKTVDRLEERGWVARHRDTEDHRTVHATS